MRFDNQVTVRVPLGGGRERAAATLRGPRAKQADLRADRAFEEAVRALVGAGCLDLHAPKSVPVWEERAAPLVSMALHDAITHGGDLFAHHRNGLSRYDAGTDTWQPVSLPERPLEDRTADFETDVQRPGYSNVKYAMVSTSKHTQRATLASEGDYLFVVGGTARDTVKQTFDFSPSPTHSLQRNRSNRLAQHRTVGEVVVKHWRGDQRLPEGMVPRADAAAAVVGSGLYVIGGFDKNDTSPRDENVRALDTAQVFDTDEHVWKSLPPLPEPRWGAQAVAVGGKLFVVGGRDERGASDRIDVFDPKSQRWEDPIRMPIGRANPSVWVDDGALHVALGHAGEECRFMALTDSDILDLRTGCWRDGPGYAAEARGPSSVHFVDGQAHVIGKPRPEEPAYLRALENKPVEGRKALDLLVANVDVDASTHHHYVTVNHVEDHRTSNVKVSIHNDVDVDVNVLPFSKTPVCGFCGRDFFLRTAVGSRSTISRADVGGGMQRLTGRVVQRQPALPRNLEAAYAYHEASDQLFPLALDGQGGFEVNLPKSLAGPLLIFGMRDGRATDAGVVDLA